MKLESKGLQKYDDDEKFTCEKIFRHMTFVINGSLQYVILVEIHFAKFEMQNKQLPVGRVTPLKPLASTSYLIIYQHVHT